MVEQAGGEQLVWGWCEYTFIVLPEADVTYWANVSRAMQHGTWGDYKEAIEAGGRDSLEDRIDPDEPPDLGERIDPDEIGGHGDGDYPPMPGQLMLEWLMELPDNPVARYGEYVDTTLNGARLDIEDEEEMGRLLAEMEGLGYQVRRDDDLIGWLAAF